MKLIPVPKCICCRTARAERESTRWPTIKLCYICNRELAQYIVQVIGVVDGNPILLELVEGVFDGRRDDSHRMWIKNIDGSFGELWVNESKQKSEINS